MPYITTESVKEIRDDLKLTFPEFRFSVRREHYSSVNIAIVSGPIDFGTKYCQVSKYHLDSSWTGEQYKMLRLIFDYATRDQRELVNDSDYGSVPTFYVNVSIGKWDKPYQVKL